MLEKLKARWGVTTLGQVVLILVVFACTGFSVLFIKQPLFALAGITSDTSPWIRIPFYILTIFPAYQILLLMYGFIFGQFQFFWNFEKRMVGRMKGLFSSRQSG